MLCSQPQLQAVAPPSYCKIQQVEKRNWSGTKRDRRLAQRKISLVWQCFDEEESDNKVVCWVCTQRLTYVHVDVNLLGEQATTSNIWQYYKYYNICHSNPQTLCCQPVRKDKATHTWNDCPDMLQLCFVEGKSFHMVPSHTVVMSWLELSLMFSNVPNLNYKWCNVLHITAW